VYLGVKAVYSTAVPVEKLTRERRRQQTRDVLVAAATDVFLKRGYDGASLEEIAETAGFTRGAIYKNFSGKEELFFAVLDRFNDRVIEVFRGIMPTNLGTGDWDVQREADLWRTTAADYKELFAIGLEFQLYALRNPSVRKRAAARHRRLRTLVAGLVEEAAERSGMRLRLPAETLASLILAAADGLEYSERVYGEELFAPFLEVLNSGMFVVD
jgi:AcrR family transcriptional regulator